MGTSNPPSERMVSPEPANVKMVQMATVAMARPPGIQLKRAVKTRSRRFVAPPCTMKYPASVNSGMDGSSGEATRRYISTGTDADGRAAIPEKQQRQAAEDREDGQAQHGGKREQREERAEERQWRPTGIANPNSAGTKRPRAAMARPIQPALAFQTARRAMTAKPTSMMASAVHFGTPGSR